MHTEILFFHIDDVLEEGKIDIAFKVIKDFINTNQMIDETIKDDYLLLYLQFNDNELKFSTNLIDYTLYNLNKSRITKSLLLLIKEIKKNINFTKKRFSENLLEEYRKRGLDILYMAEVKRKKTPNLLLYYHNVHFKISGNDLIQKIEISGRNLSSNISRFIHFGADGSPTPFRDMQIFATDLINNCELKFETDDIEQNSSKKFKVYFNKPLSINDEFRISFEFTLKNTMLSSGKDYLASAISYEECVKEYNCIIEFDDSHPDYIIVLNLNTMNESIFYPLNNIFTIKIANKPYLNNLRLLYDFEIY